jgi:hypothetical protein
MEVVSIFYSQNDTFPTITNFSPDSSISHLGLSRRSYYALSKSGNKTIGKVLALDKKSLKTIEHLNRKSIKEIISIQEWLRQQITKKDEIENLYVMDCRFINTRETLYPTDYIGVLDISLEAHNVLYKAGIFSCGKLFNMNKEDIYNLKNPDKNISEELLTLITKEKPHMGKIYDNENLTNNIQRITQELQLYRMSVLEEAYNKIPPNRLDKPLHLFLQGYNSEIIQYSTNRLSPVLKKINKVDEIKKYFLQLSKRAG